MKTFTDSTGRSWNIKLDISAAKRIKEVFGVDLLQPEAGQPPLLTQLGTDEILLCDIIYVLVKSQAEKAGISDEKFGSALGGDVILAAQTALYEEMIDFFQLRGRTDRATAVAKQKRVIELAIKKIETKIEHLDLETMIDEELEKIDSTPGSLFTDAGVSSESTQEVLPSES